MPTLLMSSRHTGDDQALWREAIRRDWSVARARGVRLPAINDDEVVIYVEALYAPTIAKMIGRQLIDPPDNWLVQVPRDYTQREISLTTLKQARSLNCPSFVKPPNDKSFAAQLYNSGADLPREFDDDMPVLVADPVRWDTEYRCFCLDGTVTTLSPYLRSGTHARRTDYQATDQELKHASEFTEEVLAATSGFTPRSVVVDVGRIVGKGWAVVEANGAWGSGIYGCDPTRVLDVIRHATIQPEQNGA